MMNNEVRTDEDCREHGILRDSCSESELRALYLLNNMKGMFSDRLLKIYEHFGSYEYAYSADIREYTEAGLMVRESTRAAFTELKRNEARLLNRMEKLSERGVQLISMFDSEYPERLDNIRVKPPLLYVSGRLPSDTEHTAAIIGSRKCSEYGSNVAELFAAELAGAGVQIVSGLAYGIDSAAARGSLKGSGESFGVLGCGINICYPKTNADLYDRMRQGEGGVITEFPPDTPAAGYNFILRNRIISGLSDVLIVIEAGKKSGTSITVGYALEQGREVYALPGRIDDPLGYGCNQFIKEGANVITEAADVLNYFEQLDERNGRSRDVSCYKNASKRDMLQERLNELGDTEKKVYEALKLEPMHIEQIAARAGADTAAVIEALMLLEAEELVSSPRHAYYRRCC